METVTSADGTAIAYDQAGHGPALTARAWSTALPHAELGALDGQDHSVDPAMLAPVLSAFLSA